MSAHLPWPWAFSTPLGLGSDRRVCCAGGSVVTLMFRRVLFALKEDFRKTETKRKILDVPGDFLLLVCLLLFGKVFSGLVGALFSVFLRDPIVGTVGEHLLICWVVCKLWVGIDMALEVSAKGWDCPLSIDFEAVTDSNEFILLHLVDRASKKCVLHWRWKWWTICTHPSG